MSSSFLNCYSCGLEEHFMDMRRASVSRRAEHLASPPMRSRSSERLAGRGMEEHGQPLDSERVENRNRTSSFHRRAMSDPFDNCEDATDKVEEFDETYGAAVLPTFPRYPVEGQRNKNCWSEPDVSIFHVRSDTYLQDKKKVPSGQYLMPARGVDIFLSDTPVSLRQKSPMLLNGGLRKLPTLLVNFRFPWGNMILYYEIPANLRPYLHPNTKLDPSLSVSERVLAKWLMGDDNYKNDRLKLIPYVAEGPWVVRNMVTGRPAIIGRKLKVLYETTYGTDGLADMLEVTLDIGSSSSTAKRIVSVCRRYMSALTVDIGFVVQGEEADELPEQMMGATRIHGPDPLKAPKL